MTAANCVILLHEWFSLQQIQSQLQDLVQVGLVWLAECVWPCWQLTFLVFVFCCCFFSPKDCSVVWSFPSLLPAYLASATWTLQQFLKCRSHTTLHKNLLLLGGEEQVSNFFFPSLPSPPTTTGEKNRPSKLWKALCSSLSERSNH